MKIIIKYIILFLIQLIEKWEYKNLSLNENDISKKIIDSIDIDKIFIDTPDGFKSIKCIHKTQPYTLWRIETENGLWLDCADNHILFNNLNEQIFIKDLQINDYIQTRYGLDKIIKIKKLPFKVSMYDVTVDSLEHIFYSNDIVSHNTTTISAFFAWYMCFHNDRNLAILANKQDTAWEIVNKVTNVFKGLPFFLKPGIINIGAGFMRLDNGCMLMSQATTKTAQIGYTIHVLYADEFAHIQPNIVYDFWSSVYPTLASSEISQCIISSTPFSEYDLFYEIWSKAIEAKNSFVPIRVDYWEVPEHDAAWVEKTKADFTEDAFAQQFELLFNRSDSLLLGAHDFNFIKKVEQEYEFQDLNKTDLDESLYRNLKWHPKFDSNENFDKKTTRFILSIDTGEGKDEEEVKDNDYNICSIFKIELRSLSQLKKLRKDELKIKNMFRLSQVGLYRDNIKDEENCAKVARSLVFDQFGEDLCKILIEMNFNGKHFLDKFSQHDKFDDICVLHTYHTKPILGDKLPRRKKAGFKISPGDREFFCKLGKQLISKHLIVINESETAREFKGFGKDKKSKYRGIGVHDDIAMSTLNVARLYEEIEYEEWLYDFFEDLEDTPIKKLISKLLEEYVEDTENINDDLYKAMYEQPQEQLTEENIMKMFNSDIGKNTRYIPSSTINRGNFNVPWRK
jgi:hypothetical protein